MAVAWCCHFFSKQRWFTIATLLSWQAWWHQLMCIKRCFWWW